MLQTNRGYTLSDKDIAALDKLKGKAKEAALAPLREHLTFARKGHAKFFNIGERARFKERQ